MKRLLRIVATVIVFGLGVYLTSSSLPVASAESSGSMFEPDEWRIGINVQNRNVNLGGAHIGETKVSGQTVSIYTDYHLGYRLDLSSPDGRMIGSKYHSEIQPMKNQKTGKNGIEVDTWAFQIPNVNGWFGLGETSERVELVKDEGIFPASRDIEINYGTKVSASTVADDYKVKLNYTLTALPPRTAVIKSITPSRVQIDGDRVVDVDGFGLTSGDNNAVTLGVDFNSNGQIDDNEGCLLIGNADGFSGKYLMPKYPDETSRGGEYRLLIHDMLGDDNDYDSGHEVVYYYQPRIEIMGSHTPIKVKSSVDIVDVVSTELSAAILTDDGEIYTVGDMPLYYGDVLAFEKTSAPTLVDLPAIHIADHPVNLTGYGNSYLLTTTQGSVYGWGDNSSGQLGDISNQIFISQPKLHQFFFDGRQNEARKVDSLVMGDGFVTVATKAGADSLLYSWGRNDRGQGGWDSDKTGSPSPMAIAENDKYPYANDEHYVQVDAGGDYLIGLTNRGRVFTWGWHGAARNGEWGDGRLGFATTDIARRVHEITYNDGINYLRNVDEDVNNPIVDIAAGDDFGLALTKAGDLYRWGNSVCPNENNLACEIDGQLNLANNEQVVGLEADGNQAVAWTNLGNVYDVRNREPRKILLMPDIEGIDLGKNNYLWTKDGHLYQWCSSASTEPADVTVGLTNPSYVLRVEGKHLDVADIWFDGNNDGFNNDQPVIKNCASTNECYLYISTAGVNSAGDYNLYAETPFGGRAVSVVHISQSRTRGLVPDLVKPTIMPLIANNSSTETGNLDEPAVESGEVEDDKPEENDVDNSITESETTDCMPDKTNETDEANEPLKSDESNPSSMTNDDDKLTTATPLIDDSSSVELVDGSIEGLLDSAGGVDINDNT